ncbi:hypothetical protein P3T36_002985 [Kitasatospora sp. MAP12-15]|uniref:hypothetical protein n=1 Tax=unclassified Kitasatospora TaxID=2633591 RepID=UPI0024768178|nr:hypothetical protein [Kitasatospora sp. MAP12-44]MDH6108854.1 hypothetical protein [Kitasatospora sp. MAP12-44]
MIGPISGKVTASTVATGISTLVFSIVAPHIWHGTITPDIEGLIESVITAAVTFVAGYVAKHGIAAAVERDVKAAVPVRPSTPSGPESHLA